MNPEIGSDRSSRFRALWRGSVSASSTAGASGNFQKLATRACSERWRTWHVRIATLNRSRVTAETRQGASRRQEVATRARLGPRPVDDASVGRAPRVVDARERRALGTAASRRGRRRWRIRPVGTALRVAHIVRGGVVDEHRGVQLVLWRGRRHAAPRRATPHHTAPHRATSHHVRSGPSELRRVLHKASAVRNLKFKY